MARTRRLEIEIVGNARDARRAFGQVESRADSFSSRMARVGRTIATGLAVGTAAVGVAAFAIGTDLVRAAEESQQVTRQTAAVIESMGGVANVTAEQVADLSERLSMQSGIDDELIQSAENVLLTFGNVRNEIGAGNDVFTRATELALDMSVAMGQDMQTSVVQLGRALNDPIRGLTALRRVGVSFTSQQEDMIRALVESGDVLGAQRVILDELGREFAGSAEAQATASARLGVVWGNLQETLGEVLLPYVERFADWMVDEGVPLIETRLVPAVQSLARWLGDELVPAVAAVAMWFRDELVPAVQGAWRWFSDNLLPVLGQLASFMAERIVPVLRDVWGFLSDHPIILQLAAAFVILVGAIALLFNPITVALAIFTVFITVMQAVWRVLQAGYHWIRSNWPALLGILTGPIGAAATIIARYWTGIRNGATAVKNWIVSSWNSVIDFVGRLPGRIASAASGMWDGIKNAFRSAINAIIRWWNNLRIPGFSLDINLPGPVPDIHFSWGGLSLPNIPTLAEGGMTLTEGLAFLHPAEIVGPFDQVAPMLTPATTTVENHYHFNIAGSVWSERELIRTINRQLDGGVTLRRKGRAL